MMRDYGQIPGQLAFGEPSGPPPRIRRALRRGPRTRPVTPPPSRPIPGTAPPPAPRPVAEWHEMTPGERLTAWAGLRAWVAWLHDRYELGAEDRLPSCWAEHPGLIEELYALKAWRQEIYSGPQPSAQAARYWHAELRQVIHAAATTYAMGCRTGHRTAPLLAADQDPRRRWAAASPLAGIPPAELPPAHPAQQLDHQAMAAAVDAGLARQAGPPASDVLLCAGTWWAPVSAGWVQAAGPDEAARHAVHHQSGGDENDLHAH